MLLEYIRSLNDNRVIGMIKAFKTDDSRVFISWVKFNEDREKKRFDKNIMLNTVADRYELWLNGCESNKKVPVENQEQMRRFEHRCRLYYKDATDFIIFGGGYAKATPSRLDRIEKKPFYNAACHINPGIDYY